VASSGVVELAPLVASLSVPTATAVSLVVVALAVAVMRSDAALVAVSRVVVAATVSDWANTCEVPKPDPASGAATWRKSCQGRPLGCACWSVAMG
jgi:hypothetical protein